MSEGITLNYLRPPSLSVPLAVRFSPVAYAKFVTLKDELGCENSTLLRELIDRGWRASFGHSIEDPAAARTVSEGGLK